VLTVQAGAARPDAYWAVYTELVIFERCAYLIVLRFNLARSTAWGT